MENNSKDIALVIVLYNPSDKEKNKVRAVAEDFQGVLVDNSTTPAFSSSSIGKMKYFSLDRKSVV